MKTLKLMNKDIDFIKVMSVYLYVIIGSAGMLVGIVIGVNN